MEDPPLLVPSWGGGNGCSACVEFSSGFPRDGGVRVTVASEGTMGGWEEQAVLQASDRRSGDRFGAAVALDQVKYDSCRPRESFDAASWNHARPHVRGLFEMDVPYCALRNHSMLRRSAEKFRWSKRVTKSAQDLILRIFWSIPVQEHVRTSHASS